MTSIRDGLRLGLSLGHGCSVVYLVFGIFIETMNRFSGYRWSEDASFMLELTPVHALARVSLLRPLQSAWIDGRISGTSVRFAYALATILILYMVSLAVGLLFGALGALRLAVRSSRPPPSIR